MPDRRKRFMHWLWANQYRLPDRVLDWRIFDWPTTFAAWLGCKLAGPRRSAPVETRKGNTE